VVAGPQPSTVYHCRITAANRVGATRATFSLSTVPKDRRDNEDAVNDAVADEYILHIAI